MIRRILQAVVDHAATRVQLSVARLELSVARVELEAARRGITQDDPFLDSMAFRMGLSRALEVLGHLEADCPPRQVAGIQSAIGALEAELVDVVRVNAMHTDGTLPPPTCENGNLDRN